MSHKKMSERKLELDNIVDILSKIKDDDFYFKAYAKDIINSYIKQEFKKAYSIEEVIDILEIFRYDIEQGNDSENIQEWFKKYIKQ
jgi:ABC-type uncharacterized transport system YnjBCD substrate-binding protein